MGSAILLIGGCAAMCGVGFATSTALEWFNNVEIKAPKGNKGKTKEASGNDNIDNLRKKLKSES